MTEASPLITSSLRRAVVLALRDFTRLPSPSLLAGAGAVEAMAVKAVAILALHETTVATIVALVTHAASSNTFAVFVAGRRTTQTDCARGTTPSIRAQTLAILAHTVQTGGASLRAAVRALITLAALARCVWLTLSVLGTLLRANLRFALQSAPPNVALAGAIVAFPVDAVGRANMEGTIRSCEKTNAIAFAVSALPVPVAVLGTLFLAAINTSVTFWANTLEINAFAPTRA